MRDRVPDYAAVDESVEIVKNKSYHSGIVSYVNGILRTITREREKIKWPDNNREVLRYLSIKYSHPEWLVQHWLPRFGKAETEQLCEVNNIPPTLTIRINKLKTTADELQRMLESQGYKLKKSDHIPFALKFIDNDPYLETIPEFKQGLFFVQDEASQLVSHIVSPNPGEVVVDTCAAPGGKTTHLAELMNNNGKIIACDIMEHKLKYIQENCQRLGITIAETFLSDASNLGNKLKIQADRVLADVPCSGTGVLRKRPDLKWRKTTKDVFVKLPQIQYDIMVGIATIVKLGGILVYSTCSMEPEENEYIIDKFLKHFPLFELENIGNLYPGLKEQGLVDNSGFVKTYPHKHNMDGFFIAVLRRKL